jgi:hypothetical protein
MNKSIFVILLCILANGLLATEQNPYAGLFKTVPRSYTQLLANDTDGGLLPDVTNTSKNTASEYLLTAYVTSRPEVVLSTATNPPQTIRVSRIGNGASFPYATCAYLQLGNFPFAWAAGDTIRFTLTHIPTGDTGTWDLVIPDNNTSALGYKQIVDPIPFMVAPPWKTQPHPAVLIAPPDSSEKITTQDISLVWTAGAGKTPSGYKVYLDTTNPPQKLVADQTETSYTPSSLLKAKTYYWQIVPYNSQGEADGCPVWSFTTGKK